MLRYMDDNDYVHSSFPGDENEREFLVLTA